MAFKRPGHLVPVSYTWLGALDNLDGVQVGKMQMDCKVYYIDVQVHDADGTFDETDFTIKANDTDTIATITIAENTKKAYADADDLDENEIAAGSTINIDVENVNTGATLGVTFVLWVVPSDRH
jgi:hypothetical protein